MQWVEELPESPEESPVSCIYKSCRNMKKTQEAINESKQQCQLEGEHHALVLVVFSWQ